MRWQTKARIMKACALLPLGEYVYKLGQKTFGRLKADPMSRIPAQIEIARWILDMGGKIERKTFFEVGTGHNPIVPIGFFLCGAEKVITVDLNKRLDFGIMRKSLAWMVENRDEIFRYYVGVVEKKNFDERMAMIEKLKHKPEKLLAEANIIYLAPTDAANTELSDSIIDYHISTTVFEHIARPDIERILKEAKRILKKDSITLHFIDLSDHFQHQDESINKINFLRYSETEWNRIGGNQFAYCNRLRASDYLSLFKRVGFDVCRVETQEDEEAGQNLKDGFVVDGKFRDKSISDLCTTQLRVVLKVNPQLETHE